jgi:hypothetical protein
MMSWYSYKSQDDDKVMISPLKEITVSSLISNLTTVSTTATVINGAMGSLYNCNTANNYSNVTISTGGTGSGCYQYTPSIWTTSGLNGSSQSSLQVSGNAEFDGDVKIKGVSITKTIEDINKRLAILVPDPAKLEHFEALKKAYNHYKTLEALCELPLEEKDE